MSLPASVLFLSATGLAVAQPRAIDPANSVMTLHVYKSGVLSAFGHNHEISTPVTAGTVDAAARTVELRIHTRELAVRDPGVSDKDRAQVQATMLSPEVLDAEHNPEIIFRSTNAQSSGESAWKVQGNLTLHGQTRPVTLDVRQEGDRYQGTASLKQTEFGIKPVKTGGGAVRVKDEVRIEFKIQLARR
uniref:YceI family protein n=1 Tax=Solibacter usitatus (strain Ellin6076) TaxID=234267 RepID=Q01QJ3_SOLUE